MSKLVKSFLVVLSALMLVAIAAGCSKGFASPEKGTASLPSSGSFWDFHGPVNGSVQSNAGGNITIDIEWVNWIKVEDNSIIFKITMNTRSVDLDQYDLSRLAILRDDAGNEYHPLSWDSAPGGHHRRGMLTFTVPDSLTDGKAKYIVMVIRDVAEVKERVLRWEL